MSVAHQDIREVCTKIVGICRRLGASWAAVAADMNQTAEKRAEALHEASTLNAAASAIEAIADGGVSMVSRLIEAEKKLAAIAEHVEQYVAPEVEKIGATGASAVHELFVTILKKIVHH